MTREGKRKKNSARFDVSLMRSKLLLGPDSGEPLQDRGCEHASVQLMDNGQSEFGAAWLNKRSGPDSER